MSVVLPLLLPITNPSDVRITSALITPRGSSVAAEVRDRVEEDSLTVLHDPDELRRVRAETTLLGFVALSAGLSGNLKPLLFDLHRWAATRQLWFSVGAQATRRPTARRRHPHPSSGVRPSVKRVREFDDATSAASAILAAHERSLCERRIQLTWAAQLAAEHELSEKGAALIAGLAIHLPPALIPDALGQSPQRFNKFVSRSVYPAFGVRSLADLMVRVQEFALSRALTRCARKRRSPAGREARGEATGT